MKNENEYHQKVAGMCVDNCFGNGPVIVCLQKTVTPLDESVVVENVNDAIVHETTSAVSSIAEVVALIPTTSKSHSILKVGWCGGYTKRIFRTL